MSKEAPYSEDEFKELLKAYQRSDIRKKIHKSNLAIIELAEEMGRKIRGVENQLLGFRYIEKHLRGEESKRKRYSKLLFKVWIEAGIEKKLGLKGKFTEDDILALSSDRSHKSEVLATKALEFYDRAKNEKLLWEKKKFPDSKGKSLKHFVRWRFAASMKKEESIDDFPDELKELKGKLTFREFKRVIEYSEQFKLLEILGNDSVFKDAYKLFEDERKKKGAKSLVDPVAEDVWEKDLSENQQDEQAKYFTSVWDMYQPLKKLTTVANTRSICQDPESQAIDVFVSQHVSSQGPQYLPIGEVMSQQSTVFEIPPYQRSYEWDKSNIEILREDLDTCALDKDAPPVFLGTLLFQVGPAGSDTTEVLDGQQRMLTVILFCIWACRLLLQNGHRKLADLIVHSYLGNFEPVHETLTPKFRPDPRDQASFKALLCTATATTFSFDGWIDADQIKSSHALEKQLENIDDVFGAAVHTAAFVSTPHYLCDLLLRLLQVCHVCRFVLDHKDDPFDTFQRLNYRGKKLQNADIVRSVVLKKCGPDSIDNFYRNEWMPIEQLIAVDETQNTKSEYKKSQLDKFFTCFAKTREPGTKKNQSVNVLTKYWVEIDAGKVSNITKELREFASYYKLLFGLNRDVIQISIERFGIELTSDIILLSKSSPPDEFGPFVIGVLEALENGECTADNAKKSIKLLASWIVRNNLCSPGASTLFGLQRVFNRSNWTAFKKSKFDSDVLFKCMDKNEFNLASLSDDTFKARLQEDNIYASKVSHCLVLAMETSPTEYKFGLPLNKADTRLSTISKFQIDHVAPQTIDGVEAWKHMKKHVERIHTIGNLVAVEERLNKEAQNESFEKRARRFHDQSVYKMARDLKQESTKSNWKSKYSSRWGSELIEDRNKQCAEILCQVFKFPYAKSQFHK